MDTSRIVLVPTDFTEASKAALEYAVYYANRMNTLIHLVHIAQRSSLRSNVKSAQEYRKRISEERRKLLQMKNGSGGAFRIKESMIITDLSTAEVLLNYPHNGSILACCVGTAGNKSSDSEGVGANTNKLIREAYFPVMSCRVVKHPIQFRNLLLPIDLSKHTNEKVDLILRFAKEFNSHIHLLAVSEFLEEWTFTKKELLQRLESAASHIRSEGIRCSTEVIRNDYVSNSVVDYAKEINADMLVVMSEHQALLSTLLFGSRTNRVIAMSSIPVISFRRRMDH